MKILIETYGCQMNEYDSAMIRSMLVSAGHSLTSDLTQADVVMVNTCTVRDRAEQRALGRLRHLRGLIGKNAILGVIGCVAQRLGDELLNEVRGLDFVVGTDRYALIPDIIEEVDRNLSHVDTRPDGSENYSVRAAPISASLSDFVGVMRGCNNYCSYCIVPYVRGRERSVPHETVLAEVKALVQLGMGDVTLLGQNVNSYRDGPVSFAGLLGIINGVPGLKRIRFATSHPKDISQELIDAIADLDKVCEHVHLPVQSGSNSILRRMNRSYTREDYVALVRSVRERIPGGSITTDVITGFPGETDEDFQATVSLMNEIRFDSAFMFRYSVREGTSAAALDDDVPDALKIERLTKAIDLQKGITTAINKKLIGTLVEVLADGPSERDASRTFGRSRSGKAVVFECPDDSAGKLVSVRITSSSAWTLHGRVEPQ
ncbi:tRNA (N6-isopentenyl adenosine(37)-C2)-methylthiotransferase MiaB [bacterium]|nr:tRNA (N6-isopentenyl adenosine(37)-C2)-methylthiotransferase MiaB [bacterium]